MPNQWTYFSISYLSTSVGSIYSVISRYKFVPQTIPVYNSRFFQQQVHSSCMQFSTSYFNQLRISLSMGLSFNNLLYAAYHKCMSVSAIHSGPQQKKIVQWKCILSGTACRRECLTVRVAPWVLSASSWSSDCLFSCIEYK